MIDMVLSLVLPFLVALAVSGVVRLSAGAERGARLMGVGLGVGFLGWWVWARGIDPMGALTPLGVVPLVTLAGVAVGAGVNVALEQRRAAAWGVAGAFGLLGVWGMSGLPVGALASGEVVARLVALGVLMAVVLGGLGVARTRAPSSPGLLLAWAELRRRQRVPASPRPRWPCRWRCWVSCRGCLPRRARQGGSSRWREEEHSLRWPEPWRRPHRA
jgi:hypothetical protein